MHEFLQRDVEYVTRVDEVLWGGLLLAMTIVIHGIGMLLTVRAADSIKETTKEARSRFPGMGLVVLIIAAWMIILVNLIEVAMWSGFFIWKHAQPSIFSAFYNAMLNYTTLQAGYLPLRWRLLEGMLGMAGLMTFAWSTSILFSLAQEYMDQALLLARQRREKRRAARAPAKPHGSGDSGRT